MKYCRLAVSICITRFVLQDPLRTTLNLMLLLSETGIFFRKIILDNERTRIFYYTTGDTCVYIFSAVVTFFSQFFSSLFYDSTLALRISLCYCGVNRDSRVFLFMKVSLLEFPSRTITSHGRGERKEEEGWNCPGIGSWYFSRKRRLSYTWLLHCSLDKQRFHGTTFLLIHLYKKKKIYKLLYLCHL
jgi:hypothetical protein